MHLLRDHSATGGVPEGSISLGDTCLRLIAGDMEVRTALGRLATPMRTRRDPERTTAGRADGGPRASGTTPEVRCGHNGLIMIHGVVGGYVARCLACQMMGPVWDDPEAARRALLELGMPYRV